MGLLTAGVPLQWPTIKNYVNLIQDRGIEQFLELYNKLNSRTKHTLKWGDEIEYTLVWFDILNCKAKLFLGAKDLLEKLRTDDSESANNCWQPEYAEYMIEGVPYTPFGRLLDSISAIEKSMINRRLQLAKHSPSQCFALTISAFPRLGCDDFCHPFARPTCTNGASNSIYYPDQAINQGHPRFQGLTRNIRNRRGKKVAINAPIYRDVHTPESVNTTVPIESDGTSPALPNHVYMDAMGFGMGCSCLQITFQSCCIHEARIMYDQLATICPIVMALSAATPAIRGYLLDWDCRWAIISASVDDRTDEELGRKPLKNERYVIPKSRFDSISLYLSNVSEGYNDIPLVYNKNYYQQLMDGGVDHLLAMHVAHLFIRDPISVFEENVNRCENVETAEDFECIQSTNWQSMRFKPPPLNSSIGWRVEFRPTELQLTDFENAAFATFILLLSRTILKLNLNFIIPLSKVDENIAKSLGRDAVLNEKFYFRRGHLLTTDGISVDLSKMCPVVERTRTYSTHNAVEHNAGEVDKEEPKKNNLFTNCHSDSVDPQDSYELMTVDEIINGSETFPGILTLIRHYVNITGGSKENVELVESYLELIQKRASGELKTTASWIRSFITNHPNYQHDSYVSDQINFDLMTECLNITRGSYRPADLLPLSPSSCNRLTSKCCLQSVFADQNSDVLSEDRRDVSN